MNRRVSSQSLSVGSLDGTSQRCLPVDSHACLINQRRGRQEERTYAQHAIELGVIAPLNRRMNDSGRVLQVVLGAK